MKEDITLLPNDFIRTNKKDMSGRWCCLLKIANDVDGFDLVDSPLTPMYWDNKVGETWVYMSPGERRLYLIKTGFPKLSHDIRITMESNCVYAMTVLGSGINVSKALPVTFKIVPENAILTIDDSLKTDYNKPVLLEAGKHQITVSATGYKTNKSAVDVSADKLFFEFSLQPIDMVKVTIKSNPEGADFYFDNVSAGKTNKQPFKYPGTYNLRLVKDGYDTIEQKITVKETGDNTFNYNLDKSTSTLTLKVEPADATVLIDNLEVKDLTLELAPGMHKLEARKAGYAPVSKQISLVKGKSASESINLIRQTGKLIFTVEPMEARVTLSDGKTWEGSNSLALPVGEYTLSAALAGYVKQDKKLSIEKGKDTILDIVLVKGKTPDKDNPKADMVYVEGGSFQMGSNDYESEKPVHRITVSSFYIGKYEVTQKEWKAVMGKNPSNWKGDDLPVEQVSWYDCVEFCNKLSRKEGLTPCYSGSGSSITCDWSANGYRLPTEAEWEFAARGGNQSKGYKYSGSNDIGSVAWYDSNSDSQTHSVGQKQANELGIYDMSGNVWEWCWDWYDDSYYGKSPAASPKGADGGSSRLLRGGSWYHNGISCRVAVRYCSNPNYRYSYNGFRVCRAM